MTLKDISAAIFDIDGTLLDSSPVWDDLGERFLKSRGVVPKPGLAEILAEMTLPESSRYLLKNYPLTDTPEDVQRALVHIISEFYRSECPLKPGAAELVSALHSRGVTMVLATAGDKELSCAALGYQIKAFISLEVEPSQKPEFYPYIEGCPNVMECNCVTGDYSMFIKVCFHTTQELDQFINQLHRFGRTRTQIVFSTPVEHRGIPAMDPEENE